MLKLLDKGAVVDAKPIEGNTSLYEAMKGTNIQLIQILLDHGANVLFKKWGGETPLACAVGRGNVDAVSLILKSAGNDAEKRQLWLSHAMAAAQKSSNTAMIQMLKSWK